MKNTKFNFFMELRRKDMIQMLRYLYLISELVAMPEAVLIGKVLVELKLK